MLKTVKMFLFTVVLMSFGFILLGSTVTAAPVTMVGFGQVVVPGGSQGDTWDSTWLADGSVLFQNNDGAGWGGSDFNNHDQISELTGTPETPGTLSGSNVSSFLGDTYSSGLYEVDGALYHIINYSTQDPENWVFRNPSILKSTDDGANWINYLGQTNTLTPDNATGSMFGDWSLVMFVKYGIGGDAPAIHGAENYVYLFRPNAGNLFMARILRSDLTAWTTTFDRGDIEYLTNTDGSTWSTNIANAVSVYSGIVSPTSIVYNYGLQRYIMTAFKSNNFLNPIVESTIFIGEAEYPWGPWTDVLGENVNQKENDNLSLAMLTQKFKSTDGKKMWTATSGKQGTGVYGLQLLPMYLTSATPQTIEAESATLSGVVTPSPSASPTPKPGYTGSSYVTSFNTIGDKVTFTASIANAGAYILKMRYNTTDHQIIGFYVNGNKVGDVKLGKSEQTDITWTEVTMFAWLTSGSNTIAFQLDSSNTGNLNVDHLKLALYSTVPESLPGATPPPGSWTRVNDNDAAVTSGYSAGWTYSDATSGAHNVDTHYTTTTSATSSYTFTGTGVRWIGPKNNNRAKANVYIDDVWQITIDPYNATLQSQMVLYENTTLPNGPHTIKIENTHTKNASSTDYYNAIDAFEFFAPTWTRVNDNHASVTSGYSAGWSYSSATAGAYNTDTHYTTTNLASSSYTFTGTGIRWIGPKNNNRAKVKIYIDTELKGTIDPYSSSLESQKVLYEFTGLSNTSHTIKVENTNTKNFLSSDYYNAIDAYEYTN